MDDLKNDIEKYLKGELPEAKMHALEKQALDDPFLADALEGASGIASHEFAQDMTQLSQKLGARLDQKKVIPLWIWPARIAAGLLVIAVATYVIISFQESQKQSEDMAYKAEEKNPPPGGNTNDTLRADQSDGYLSMNDTKTERQAEEKIAPAPSAPKPLNEVASASPEPAAPVETPPKKSSEAEQPVIAQQEARRDEIADAAEPQAETEIRSDLAKEKAPSVAAAPSAERKKRKAGIDADAEVSGNRASPTAGYAYSTKKDSAVLNPAAAPSQIVLGRVTSTDDGAALPGVNVIIKGSSTGTVTDIQGNYQLPLSNPKTTLVFSFIGMESKEVPVSNNPVVNVSLNQDVSQLSEVVVVGYGEGKEEEEKSFPTFDMAEPAGGRRAFKKYLEDKMVYPQEALDNKIEGRVTIQFTIETSGQVSNFNVIKGIGYGCDDELIRLIKDGPRWAPMKRDDEPVKGRVRVRMRFTLPKKK